MMDPIKEAMIREEDTGERDPRIDPYRDRPCSATAADWLSFMPRYVDNRADLPMGMFHLSIEIAVALEAETRRAEEAHAMTLRQSFEIERLQSREESYRMALKYISTELIERIKAFQDIADAALEVEKEPFREPPNMEGVLTWACTGQ